MEMEIPVLEGCQSSPKLPGWSKTGKRTRATRSHHQGPAASDDEARDPSALESDEFVTENLPPKKRKLDSSRERKHHTCNICSRSFSSYQALGGHKAHHNSKDQKAKPVGGGDGVEDDDDAVVGGGGGGGGVHRCTFCYKVFSKGQALGGHRRHCQRPIMTENREKMCSFDLNELPPEWLGS